MWTKVVDPMCGKKRDHHRKEWKKRDCDDRKWDKRDCDWNKHNNWHEKKHCW